MACAALQNIGSWCNNHKKDLVSGAAGGVIAVVLIDLLIKGYTSPGVEGVIDGFTFATGALLTVATGKFCSAIWHECHNQTADNQGASLALLPDDGSAAAASPA